MIQHEIDHLDGVLIVDRAQNDERKGALRELRLRIRVSVAYFGTAPFGADVLRRLVERGRIEVGVVVSQPDRPSGRGRSLAPPPVAVAARELGLELRADRERQRRSRRTPTPASSWRSARSCGAPLLGAYPLVNLHPSSLPRWRGAAPVERAIMAGDTETAVAAIEVAPELDAGPILAEAPIAIGPEDDAGAVRVRALELGVPLLERALLERPPAAPAGRGGRHLRAQDHGRRPRARLVRGRRPSSTARCAGSRRTSARAASSTAGRSWSGGRVRRRRLGVGEIGPPLVVGTGDGALEILELQPAGKRRMAAAEYLRGLREPPRLAS